MSAPWHNASPARRLEIIRWIEAGADPTSEQAVTFRALQDMERDELVTLTGYRHGDGTRLLVTLTPGGMFERDRLKAIADRPCPDCGERPCTCIPF